MEKSRRVFLTQLSVLSATSVIGKPLSGARKISKNFDNLQASGQTVTVRHTNDLHGQTGPFIDGKGGIEQISALWRDDPQKGLLLDAGGFTGGTNHQEQHADFIKIMNGMGYLAAGISPRELTHGAGYLAGLAGAMRFTLVNCNHQFKGPLSGYVKPYITVYHNNIKIGITGVSSRLKGFKYADPLLCANRTAAFLKATERCDMVICLSYLGSENEGMATQTENIDMIIGGGQSKLMRNALVLKNASGDDIVLAVTGSKGIITGRSAFSFDRQGRKTGFQPDFLMPRANRNESAAISFEYLRQQKNRLILV